jgi:hypothetical protein
MMQQTKPFLLDGQDRVKCNRGKKFKEYIKPISDEWKRSLQTTPVRPRSNLTVDRSSSTPPQVNEPKTGKGVVAFYSNPKEF